MNNHSVIPAFDFRRNGASQKRRGRYTSRKIAKYFGKRHGDVLRKIEQVKADCSREFSQRNFASADYIDEQGKVRRCTALTKDNWIMVVMGVHWESCCGNQGELYRSIQLDGRTTEPPHGNWRRNAAPLRHQRNTLKAERYDRQSVNERTEGEKRVPAVEHEYILQVTQPELLIN